VHRESRLFNKILRRTQTSSGSCERSGIQ